MKKIFLFIVISIMTYSYELEIFIQKPIFFEKDIVTYEILTSPLNSKYNLEKTGSNSYVFTAETKGVYEIQFKNEFGEIQNEFFEVKGKNYKEEEIKKVIKIKDKYEALKELYFYSENPIEVSKYIYNYFSELAQEKDSIDEVLNGFLLTNMFFKNFEFEQKAFLEKIYKIKKSSGDVRGEVLTLAMLKNYDVSYIAIHGKRALETGINEKEAIKDLEKLVDKNLNVEASKVLGLYYGDKNSNKAKRYLYIGDKKEFFKLLLKNTEEEQYLHYYEKLSENEKLEIDEVKNLFEKEKMMELFLQKGMINIEEQRFDVAKDYYEKVVASSTDEEKLKNALFNLGKINIMIEDYNKALEIFNDYLEKYNGVEEVEALYYLGLCNFKLKNFEKSDIIFNQIKKTYKYSIWDEKIKILLKEI